MGCIFPKITAPQQGIGATISSTHTPVEATVTPVEHTPLAMSFVGENSITGRVAITPKRMMLSDYMFGFGMHCRLPESVAETYTRLTYIESTGVQHIELDYQIKDTDTIDVLFENLSTTDVDKFLFGSTNTWVDAKKGNLWVRFGLDSDTSNSVTNGVWRRRLQLSKGQVVQDETATTSLDYSGIREGKLAVFSGLRASGEAYSRGIFRVFFFRVIGGDGSIIINLMPAKRDSDGKIGMIDLISGRWYGNIDNDDDFVGGNEIEVTSDYELIDRVLFSRNKAYDTQYQGDNTTSIDVMFQRTDTSAADYLFGCSPSNNARITAYLSQSGAWRYGVSLYKGFTVTDKYIYIGRVTPKGITVNDKTQTYTSTAFTTVQDVPVGGHRSSESSANITKTFRGYIYYFRMWHGDELLVDWQPCKRKSDGVEGFWDCVTHKFIEPL